MAREAGQAHLSGAASKAKSYGTRAVANALRLPSTVKKLFRRDVNDDSLARRQSAPETMYLTRGLIAKARNRADRIPPRPTTWHATHRKPVEGVDPTRLAQMANRNPRQSASLVRAPKREQRPNSAIACEKWLNDTVGEDTPRRFASRRGRPRAMQSQSTPAQQQAAFVSRPEQEQWETRSLTPSDSASCAGARAAARAAEDDETPLADLVPLSLRAKWLVEGRIPRPTANVTIHRNNSHYMTYGRVDKQVVIQHTASVRSQTALIRGPSIRALAADASALLDELTPDSPVQTPTTLTREGTPAPSICRLAASASALLDHLNPTPSAQSGPEVCSLAPSSPTQSHIDEHFADFSQVCFKQVDKPDRQPEPQLLQHTQRLRRCMSIESEIRDAEEWQEAEELREAQVPQQAALLRPVEVRTSSDSAVAIDPTAVSLGDLLWLSELVTV